jgi:hypothetical protein
MTNIGAIAGVTNLGPVSGDLSGSVAATILGHNSDDSFNVQHYWVTSGAETIKLRVAVLSPHIPNERSEYCGGALGALQTDFNQKYAGASLSRHRVLPALSPQRRSGSAYRDHLVEAESASSRVRRPCRSWPSSLIRGGLASDQTCTKSKGPSIRHLIYVRGGHCLMPTRSGPSVRPT